MNDVLHVSEIFHSIQGESTRAGLPCVFVRLAGCHLRCRWCDTEYAFHDGRPMTLEAVVREVAGYGCTLVEVTGGEPLLQDGAVPLLRRLVELGYRVLLETSGSLPVDSVPEGVARILDVKCPGSGEASRNRWDNLSRLRAGDEVKFVIGDRDDYEWASRVVRERDIPPWCPVLFAPVHGELDPGELGRWILDDRLPVRLQVQLHKVLWPEVVRGA